MRRFIIPILALIATPAAAQTRGFEVDRGAVVGTTPVTIMPANRGRHGYSIQVQSPTATCFRREDGTATADYHSLQIPPGGYYAPEPSHIAVGPVSIVCSAAGTSVYAREW